ncbi:MAG: DNA starvation/stationary phase protection protein [Novosphingobium sp. 28-62-57]|uniref:Dps family protein n=1 Tax=unclassified Novosphingobium TaxID=2644732 RepID=UPI000BC50A19|nr:MULTISPECIES: DNA starvation/stationary phase protection protein [unclassified Novosphingobium]OYW48543.1 MAG: DNA starvation/stationary phase protection protein [Novosphingobium sp. 12-62-10]OYZ08480.1 MAG: DNA starvation/stationary phase protection protein [Novosphingobium sp. 28-62-57]OYZ39196.1 MAG: DNA starvation/stationary phase protection protein [Novosphingobium sp. 16-62-11]OZA36400.1 MAG: DNA starvation/stationary phase protection protein [Novosphingobium sp. 17-62-9]
MPGDNAKKALIDSLNGLLADYFTLYLKTKNYHWHVAGPQFRDLHLLFDEQATELFTLTDTIAERVRKNGGDTLTGIGAIAAKASIKDDDRAKVDAMDMVKALRDDNVALVKAIRAVKDAATAAGDNATEGMADDWTDQAEQRAWFLTQIAA